MLTARHGNAPPPSGRERRGPYFYMRKPGAQTHCCVHPKTGLAEILVLWRR
jgi:hypothetical protein